VLQANSPLTPAEVREILMRTARDVTTGINHPNFGNPATVGRDTATGSGLVDAHRAVLLAKLRYILQPIRSVRPPVTPVVPFWPPVSPVIPFRPVIPVIPFRPPVTPVVPPVSGPLEGAQVETAQPRANQHTESGKPTMSEEDIAELERFIIDSDNQPEL
jgi:hypothetical protein